MTPAHVALAVLVAGIWGFNFVVIRLGLDGAPPLLLAALRFVVAALPALVVPRPALPWAVLVRLGLVWFLCQFGFLFTGMRLGVPPGLASVLMQSQAFFTILFAAAALRERPTGRQSVGVGIAGLGLLAIGASTVGPGSDVPPLAFLCVMAGAVSWACGNVLTRGVRAGSALALVVWLSVVPPLPLLALSLVLEGPAAIGAALGRLDAGALAAVLYLGPVATLAAFGLWNYLLARYPLGLVAPFSLLAPLFGMSSSAVVFGERFGVLRLAGTGLILAGLAVVALPDGLLRVRRT